MANEFRVKNGLIVSGNATVSGIVLDGNTITGVDDSGEFTGNDPHIMTSAGINDKFGVIAGSTSIVTVGTITTGTWNGTAIDLANYVTGVLPSANLDADTAHLSGTQTFTGAKTFSGGITNATSYGPHSTGYVIMGASNDTLAITSNGAHNTHISTNSNTNSGSILIQQGANNPITITPNGTGNVNLNTDTVRVGDNNADATITTRGTGELTL